MTSEPAAQPRSSQAIFMLLSACIFGYFGFATLWNHTGVNGEFLLFVALLEWTLKGAAIGFGLSFLLAMVRPAIGGLVYSLVGLVSAILFVVVAIMDFNDQQHTAMSPILLVIFAVWNGYGSWAGIQEFLAGSRPRAVAERPQ